MVVIARRSWFDGVSAILLPLALDDVLMCGGMVLDLIYRLCGYSFDNAGRDDESHLLRVTKMLAKNMYDILGMWGGVLKEHSS